MYLNKYNIVCSVKLLTIMCFDRRAGTIVYIYKYNIVCSVNNFMCYKRRVGTVLYMYIILYKCFSYSGYMTCGVYIFTSKNTTLLYLHCYDQQLVYV